MKQGNNQHKNIVLPDLQTTFIIKTFERPEKLFVLLKSIDKFYPEVPVIIIDDSKKPIKKEWLPHIQYVYTEYDIGVSEGKNRAVKLVKTKYFVPIDDDFEFTEQTHIEVFVTLLQKYNFDLIGGRVCDFGHSYSNFTGFLKIYRKVLYTCLHKFSSDVPDAVPVDITVNFFLAKTDVIQKNPWDSELKTRDHHSFFFNLKKHNVKVGYTPYVSVNHWPDRGKKKDGTITNQVYHDNRMGRYSSYISIFHKKEGIKKHVGARFYYLPFSPSLPFGRPYTNPYQKYFLFRLCYYISVASIYFFVKKMCKLFGINYVWMRRFSRRNCVSAQIPKDLRYP